MVLEFVERAKRGGLQVATIRHSRELMRIGNKIHDTPFHEIVLHFSEGNARDFAESQGISINRRKLMTRFTFGKKEYFAYENGSEVILRPIDKGGLARTLSHLEEVMLRRGIKKVLAQQH